MQLHQRIVSVPDLKMERHLTILFAKRSLELSGGKLSQVLVPRPHPPPPATTCTGATSSNANSSTGTIGAACSPPPPALTSRLRLRCKGLFPAATPRTPPAAPAAGPTISPGLKSGVHRLRRWNQGTSRWEAFWAISPRHRRRHQLLLSNLWRRQLVERVITRLISDFGDLDNATAGQQAAAG